MVLVKYSAGICVVKVGHKSNDYVFPARDEHFAQPGDVKKKEEYMVMQKAQNRLNSLQREIRETETTLADMKNAKASFDVLAEQQGAQGHPEPVDLESFLP